MIEIAQTQKSSLSPYPTVIKLRVASNLEDASPLASNQSSFQNTQMISQAWQIGILRLSCLSILGLSLSQLIPLAFQGLHLTSLLTAFLLPVLFITVCSKGRSRSALFLSFGLLWIILEWLFSYGQLGPGCFLFLALAALDRLAITKKNSKVTSASILFHLYSLYSLTLLLLNYLQRGLQEIPAHSSLLPQAHLAAVLAIAYPLLSRGRRLPKTELIVALLPMSLIAFLLHSQEYAYFFFGKSELTLHPELYGSCFAAALFFLTCSFKSSVNRRQRITSFAVPLLVLVISAPIPFRDFSIFWQFTPDLFEGFRITDWIFGNDLWRDIFKPLLPAPQAGHTREYNFPGILLLLLGSGIIGTALLFAALYSHCKHYNDLSPLRIAGLLVCLFLLPGSFTPLPLVFLLASGIHMRKESVERIPVIVFRSGFALTLLVLLFFLSHALYSAWTSQNRAVVATNQHSEQIVQQIVVAEDLLFPVHSGVDLARIKRVLQQSIKSRQLNRGGSTISMQLAKIWYLPLRKTALRKIDQIIIGIFLEFRFSKKEIMELYLGSLHFGAEIHGIEEAAQHYFNKSALQLTPRESAMLVCSIENPQRFNPQTTPISADVRRRIKHIEQLRTQGGMPFENLIKEMRLP